MKISELTELFTQLLAESRKDINYGKTVVLDKDYFVRVSHMNYMYIKKPVLWFRIYRGSQLDSSFRQEILSTELLVDILNDNQIKFFAEHYAKMYRKVKNANERLNKEAKRRSEKE